MTWSWQWHENSFWIGYCFFKRGGQASVCVVCDIFSLQIDQIKTCTFRQEKKVSVTMSSIFICACFLHIYFVRFHTPRWARETHSVPSVSLSFCLKNIVLVKTKYPLEVFWCVFVFSLQLDIYIPIIPCFNDGGGGRHLKVFVSDEFKDTSIFFASIKVTYFSQLKGRW